MLPRACVRADTYLPCPRQAHRQAAQRQYSEWVFYLCAYGCYVCIRLLRYLHLKTVSSIDSKFNTIIS